jgi:hypothetical protein
MFKEIESLIDEMIENVGKIRQNRETNSVAVTKQKQIIEYSEHQSSDCIQIWRISHKPQTAGELDIVLISCNKLVVLK